MSAPNPFSPSARFDAACRCFDEENSKDPNYETVAGTSQPREFVYARWLTDWVLKLKPDATEELRLAARCQHLCRWEIPRTKYPMNRAGYLQWRSGLRKFHAEKAGAILREAGYPDTTICKVQDLNLKKNFPSDPESCVLEDALCLVFLEHQFADLAAKTSEDKVINALKKSWGKMTPAARALAAQLPFAARERELLNRALAG